MKAATVKKAMNASVLKAAKSVKTLKRKERSIGDEGNTEVSIDAKDIRQHTEDEDERTRKNSTWNDMLHLSIKRFDDNDPTLTTGAKNNRSQYPYVAIAEYDKSGRCKCKHCGAVIQPKGVLRISLMMECHKGYRNPCTLHESCFWSHREFEKINTANEIHIHESIIKKDSTFKDRFTETFNTRKNK